MSDLDRDALMHAADEAIRQAGGPNVASVHFKWTCTGCGERVMFREPNTLYERGECNACGLDQPVTQGGFALLLITKAGREKLARARDALN